MTNNLTRHIQLRVTPKQGVQLDKLAHKDMIGTATYIRLILQKRVLDPIFKYNHKE